MLSSNSSWAPRTTSGATVRSWVRTPFGTRSERTRPTRPYIDYVNVMAHLRAR